MPSLLPRAGCDGALVPLLCPMFSPMPPPWPPPPPTPRPKHHNTGGHPILRGRQHRLHRVLHLPHQVRHGGGHHSVHTGRHGPRPWGRGRRGRLSYRPRGSGGWAGARPPDWDHHHSGGGDEGGHARLRRDLQDGYHSGAVGRVRSFQASTRHFQHAHFIPIVGPWWRAKAALVRNYLEVYWPCAGGLSVVNAIGTQLRDPINTGLTRLRMAVWNK